MASNKTISIGFKIQQDPNGGFKLLVSDAKAFTEAMQRNVAVADKLQRSIVGFGQISQGLDSLNNFFTYLSGGIKDSISAYNVQMEAEHQLEQVMRNTMGARAEDIQSIKDFCSAQQQIGIVGDEVQLAGAQELATYLQLKGSLKSLIPVMNDMIAQQYGYSHTAENASQIATMLGKVMNGQTGALSRYGYTFNEAQENILKYGTEAERCAVLVDVVSQSVGGMNTQLANTDTGRIKQLENNLGDLKEELGGVLKKSELFLTIASHSTTAVLGVMKLVSAVRVLTASLTAANIAVGAIGLALSAAAGAAYYFATQTDTAASAIDRLTDAQQRARIESERAERIHEAEAEAYENARSAIDDNIAKLDAFKGNKAEEKKMVKEMNDTYGKSMGYYSTIQGWYVALTKNSDAYCKQIEKEIRLNKLKEERARLQAERREIKYNPDGSLKKLPTTQGEETVVTARYNRYNKEHQEKIRQAVSEGKTVRYNQSQAEVLEKRKIPSENEIAGRKLGVLEYEYNKVDKEIKDLMANPVKMPVMGSSVKPEDKDLAGGTPSKQTRLQQINSELAKKEEQYAKTSSETVRESIRREVDALKKEKAEIELAKAELSRPMQLETMQDFDDEISYQRKLIATASVDEAQSIQKTIDALQQQREAMFLPADLDSIEDYNKAIEYHTHIRQTASMDELAEHDEIIRKLTEEKEARERSAHVSMSADKITTYRQLEEEIAYLTELLRNGTEEEKRFAAQKLPSYMEKEREMNLATASVGVAVRPEDAQNLAEVERAISLLDQKIQNASADEVEEYQRTKMAFEEKKKALERGIEIPRMQMEVADLMKLSDRELKIKVRGMGFEELSDRIRDIDRQLTDLDNPPTEGQRKALEELRATYESWRRECVMTFDTFKSGWSAVSGVGSGIDRLSGALDENATVWQRLTSVVDGFIQVYEGISAIIGIINTLNAVTNASAVAHTASAAATTADTTAKGVEAAASEASAVAKAPEIAANKLAAQSFVELAAAEYMAAHAEIPFAGYGIAAGFTAAAVATVQAINAIPFAEGGVVAGPTLALVGEYAGARNNPEVIAPLDRLQQIIEPRGSDFGHVEFEIRQDRLVGILKKAQRKSNRT